MRSISTLTLAVLSLLDTSHSLQLVERRNADARVFGFDIQRNHVEDPVSRDQLRRRQSKTVTQVLDNQRNLYFSNASLGTPPQSGRFHIDTGSSDLWVNAPTSQLCNSQLSPCSRSGVYDANASSTYEFVNSDFQISYADGSGASGDYVVDAIRFGGRTIPGLQFGVGYTSTSPEGVLGIGYPSREAQVVLQDVEPYANLPQLMVDQGLIRSKAYSLWLNDLSASSGSILFGGVNTEKYLGQLATLPIQVRPGAVRAQEFFLTLTGVEYGDRALGGDRADAVLLDSGSSLIYLPDDLTLEIYNAVDATIDQRRGVAVVPCSSANLKDTLKFTFSAVTITVDMTELVLPGTSSRFAGSGESACVFGILPSGGATSVLGDPFLRSAYVVYDIDNSEISLAQTNFNATRDRILEIGTGPEAVPDADDVRNPKKADAEQFGGRRIRPTATDVGGAAPTESRRGGAISERMVPMGAVTILALGALGLSLVL